MLPKSQNNDNKQKQRGKLPQKLKGSDQSLTTGYVPYCPINGWSPGANLWLTGLSDNDHLLWRLEDRWLDVGCWQSLVVCWVRKGQSKLMGSIRSIWIPFILIVISQSHHSPLSVFYSTDLQVDPQTHTSTDTVVLFLFYDSHDPLCLCIYVLCLDLSLS